MRIQYIHMYKTETSRMRNGADAETKPELKVTVLFFVILFALLSFPSSFHGMCCLNSHKTTNYNKHTIQTRKPVWRPCFAHLFEEEIL